MPTLVNAKEAVLFQWFQIPLHFHFQLTTTQQHETDRPRLDSDAVGASSVMDTANSPNVDSTALV